MGYIAEGTEFCLDPQESDKRHGQLSGFAPLESLSESLMFVQVVGKLLQP